MSSKTERMAPLLEKLRVYGNKIHLKILDLGCGHGETTNWLQSKGFHVTPMDIVNASLFKNVQPIVYDGYHIPARDNSYDVVICSFILHHIPHHQQLIKEIRRVCRGYVMIFEDTPVNNWDRFFNRLHAGSEWGQCVDCFRSVSDWVKTFKKARFNLKWLDPVGRWEFPFSACPLIYPVSRYFMVFE